MKYTHTQIIGDAGEHLVASKVIKLLGFPCRLLSIDIGIDAEIEITDDNFRSTGEFIKAQIKTTISDKLYWYIEKEHIEYWNKINLPVIIFLVHINTEKIYWHIIDEIDKYEKLDSGYKVQFNEKDILDASNKFNFRTLSKLPFKRKIEKIFDKAYALVVKDNLLINSDQYDLTTFEEFVFHSNMINHNFKEANDLILKHDLKIIKTEYSDMLNIIEEYLDKIEEEKEQILLDYGNDYYDYLDGKNFTWD